ncbi:MAG: hypothetical protein L6R42_009540, partial [Xanthoria sp. 1 TBL-2021]
RLRKTFRVERKVREQEGKRTEDLKERMSLGMDLLAESEEDRRRVGFVDFGVEDGEMAVAKARSKPLFGMSVPAPDAGSRVKHLGITKTIKAVQDQRAKLRMELGDNTRAAVDPFLSAEKASLTAKPIIKRKKPPEANSLVDYESDST